MSYPNRSANTNNQAGFSLVELVIVIVLVALLGSIIYGFFKTNFFTYLNLQNDASNLTEVTLQSQRVSTVVRGITDITSANGNDLQVYAYFYPQDAYVSRVHYYLNAGQTILYADVTPMTANPPSGTPINSAMKTFSIIDNYKQLGGTTLFTYYDAANTQLSSPIADTTAVKAIQINLAARTTGSGNEIISTQVSLRNRKTNL